MAASLGPTRDEDAYLGWTLRNSVFVALDGRKVWVVSARRNGHSFSVQGTTREEAREAAQQLARRLSGGGRDL